MTDTMYPHPASMSYDELVEAVNEADRLYYDEPDSATMPDAVYDAMYERLVQIEAGAFPALAVEHIRADSPTRRVQGSSTFAPTRHSVPMLSLDKVTETSDLSKFVTTAGAPVFLVEPKYDGASLSLEYEDGMLVRAVTRGDGTTGDDVTSNALLIRGVPPVLGLDGEPFDGWVRGEVVILRDDFEQVNADGRFANPRNAAAGALRHKDHREARRRRLTFLAYDSSDGIVHLGNGFLGNDYRLAATPGRVQEAVEQLLARRASDFPFETDGIVIKVEDLALRTQLGATGKHPRWAVAFKTAGDTAQTILSDVTWQVGAGGSVTPVAELEPVYLAGTTIRRATLHNPKFIRDMYLTIGATVVIRRMGDVIPGVDGTIRDGHAKIEIPTHCPDCDTMLVQEGNSGQLKCPDASGRCTAQTVGRLVKWASRDAADIDAIGPTWIETFVRAGLLTNPASFYNINKTDLLRFEGMGETRAEQFLQSIRESKNLGMRRALIGLNIPMASEGTAKRLCRHFGSVYEVAEAAITTGVNGVEDVGPAVSANLTTFFASNGSLLTALRVAGVNLDRLDEDAPVAKAATSKTFCVTGGFEGYSNRKEPVAILERAGWTSKSGVAAGLDYLIQDSATPSSKSKKAESLGIRVITMAEAMQLAGVS